jgi:hypothetical protein
LLDLIADFLQHETGQVFGFDAKDHSYFYDLRLATDLCARYLCVPDNGVSNLLKDFARDGEPAELLDVH